jgi:hypothetical protein
MQRVEDIQGLSRRDQSAVIRVVDDDLVTDSFARNVDATFGLDPIGPTGSETDEVAFNEVEIRIRRYQRMIKREGNLAKKVDLIMELYDAEAGNWGNVKADGPKTYIKRVYKIARCILTCYKGDKSGFCKTRKKIDCSRYRCPHGHIHKKRSGLDVQKHIFEVQQNLPPMLFDMPQLDCPPLCIEDENSPAYLEDEVSQPGAVA